MGSEQVRGLTGRRPSNQLEALFVGPEGPSYRVPPGGRSVRCENSRACTIYCQRAPVLTG